MKTKKKKTKFVYQRRSADEVRKRATQSGGMYDNPFGDHPIYKTKQGENHIRILPPTWDNPSHHGIDVWVHYGVGATGDKSTYLCLSKMKNEPCPVCEEFERATRRGDDPESLRELRPTRRVLVWLLDRKDAGSDPMLWAMPWTHDKEINQAAVDPESKEVVFIDDPETGRDVFFTIEGSQRNTKYGGVKTGSNPKPLSKNPKRQAELLDFLQENPLPEVLVYYDYDHIKARLDGMLAGAADSDDDDEDDEPMTRHRTKKSTKASKKSKYEDEDEEDEAPFDADEDEEKEADEDSDDDEDEPAPRKRSKAKAQVDEDDEDEEEDDDEDDEDEAEDEDDEDDEDEEADEDEDEDEDEEPTSRKVKTKSKVKAKAQVDEDDEDEEEDDEDEEEDDDEDEDEEEEEKGSARSKVRAGLRKAAVLPKKKKKKGKG